MKSKWAHYKPTQTAQNRNKKYKKKSEKNRSSHIINKEKPKLRSEAAFERRRHTRWSAAADAAAAGAGQRNSNELKRVQLTNVSTRYKNKNKAKKNQTQNTSDDKLCSDNEDSRRIRSWTWKPLLMLLLLLQSYLEWIRICIWKRICCAVK